MSLFDIDANGRISVASGATLDYESGTTSYTLTITVTDANDRSTTEHDITIRLTNLNDENPVATVVPGKDTAEVATATSTSNSMDVSTGYRIKLTDPDGDDLSSCSVVVPTAAFTFKKVNGQENVRELFLIAGHVVTDP